MGVINSDQTDYKQLLDDVFVISGIMKVKVCKGDNPYQHLAYFGYHKNQI